MIESDRPHINLAQRLIVTVSQYRAYLSKRLKPLGIGLSEYPVLLFLFHRSRPGVKINQRDIAEHQHKDPALITRAVKNLEKKGCVRIEADADNRAQNVLSLTDQGKELAQTIDDMVWVWEEKAFSDMSQDERRQLKRLLARLVMPQ